MKNLDLRAGFRRAAIFIALYAVILYTMNILFPRPFGITQEQLPGIAIQGAFFFLLLGVLFAFTEKRRKRRIAELRAKNQGKTTRPEGENAEPGPYKGKPNPNTSRKKSRRRR